MLSDQLMIMPKHLVSKYSRAICISMVRNLWLTFITCEILGFNKNEIN